MALQGVKGEPHISIINTQLIFYYLTYIHSRWCGTFHNSFIRSQLAVWFKPFLCSPWFLWRSRGTLNWSWDCHSPPDECAVGTVMALTRLSSFVCCKFLWDFSCRMQFMLLNTEGIKHCWGQRVAPLLHIPLPWTPEKLLVAQNWPLRNAVYKSRQTSARDGALDCRCS